MTRHLPRPDVGRDALRLYTRANCHLCEEMRAALEPWRKRLGFELEVVEIDDDPALLARFGERVPVLMHGEREICQYALDEEALREFLRDV